MTLALIYDFDGTLSPGNMQEYDFIPAIGKGNREFWDNCNRMAEENDADPILTYMNEMIRQATVNGVSLRREAFAESGRKVELYAGVESWFERIDRYGEKKGIEVVHYINSSGLREMIEGTSIARHFRKIFASSFLYSVDGVAYWPGVAVNYTNKTQFIFKISKGIDSVYDSKAVNRFVSEQDRPVPFSHMIYIGDGTTDIPCMRLVKEKQGHSIAVYNPADRKVGHSLRQLVEEHRVNFVAPADYTPGSRLEEVVHAIIDKVAADDRLQLLEL
jgi:hypothetical protein